MDILRCVWPPGIVGWHTLDSARLDADCWLGEHRSTLSGMMLITLGLILFQVPLGGGIPQACVESHESEAKDLGR